MILFLLVLLMVVLVIAFVEGTKPAANSIDPIRCADVVKGMPEYQLYSVLGGDCTSCTLDDGRRKYEWRAKDLNGKMHRITIYTKSGFVDEVVTGDL